MLSCVKLASLLANMMTRKHMWCLMTSPTFQKSIWRIRPHGPLPVPRRAAPVVLLVKPTRLASTILCVAAPTQRIRTIPACTPIASLALMNGKQEKGLENHPGKDDADVLLRSKDFLLISFMSLIIISHISRRPITLRVLIIIMCGMHHCISLFRSSWPI